MLQVTDVYLVRHGSTDWNEAGRAQGQTDVPLNARGRCQARAAGERLRALGVRPAAIYASDLERAAETARQVAQVLGGPPVHLDARLRERRLGPAEGLTRAEILARFGSSLYSALIPGAEAVTDVIRRFGAALEEIATRHAGAAVVVVSHGGAMGCWLRHRLPAFADRQPGPIENGQIFGIQHSAAGWQLLPGQPPGAGEGEGEGDALRA